MRVALGLVDVEVYDTIMEAVKSKNPGPVMTSVEEMLFHGFDLQEFITGFEEYLRTLLFANIPQILEKNLDCAPDSSRVQKLQSLGFSEKTVLRMAEIVRKTEHELKWTAFPRFSVELALLKLVYLDTTVSVEQLLESFEKKRSEAPAPAQMKIAPVFPKPPACDKHKNEAPAGSDRPISLETAYKNIANPAPDAQLNHGISSINDEIQREPIIKSVLDIFDGDVIS